MPQVSVIIPAYNAAGTIKEALDSVAAQTFQDYEVIVVDDGSTDDTARVVREWIDDYESRITHYPSPITHTILATGENRGPAAARNRGIAQAKGEWIAFLDADDAWLPWRLADQFEVLTMFPDADLICGNVTFDWKEDVERPVVSRENCREVVLKDFADENPVGTTTVLVRKEAVERVGGFDERFRGPEDLDLWMRICVDGLIVRLDAFLARYHDRPGSLSVTGSTFLPEVLRVYEKAYAPDGCLHEYRGLRRRTAATMMASAAWMHFIAGERVRAIMLMLRSWLCWCRRLKVEETDHFWRAKLLMRIIGGNRPTPSDRKMG